MEGNVKCIPSSTAGPSGVTVTTSVLWFPGERQRQLGARLRLRETPPFSSYPPNKDDAKSSVSNSKQSLHASTCSCPETSHQMDWSRCFCPPKPPHQHSNISRIILLGAYETLLWVVSHSPLLLQCIFQHFDPPHKVFLQVLLAFPLPLQEGDLGLKSQK